MKKTLALILTLILLLSTFVSCGEDAPQSSVSELSEQTVTESTSSTETSSVTTVDESLKRSLAGDWSIYLTHKEHMSKMMLWMIEYAEVFFENPTREKLINARAAISAVHRELTLAEFPNYKVTAEQHADLIAAGCDVSGILVELNRLESIRDDFIVNCDSLLSMFYTGVFFAPIAETTKEYLEYLKVSVDVELELSAHYTDDLMFSLHSKTLSDDFLTFIKENTPLVAKFVPAFSTEYSVITQRVNDTIDKYNDSLDLLNTNLGKRQVANDQFEEIWSNKDLDRLQTLKLNIANTDNMFALPQVYNPAQSSCLYWYTDTDNEYLYASPLAPITMVPNRCAISISHTTKTDYMNYFLKLIELGLEPHTANDNEEESSATFLFDDDSVMIEYQDGKITIAMIGNSVYLVPIYYMQ